MFQYIALLWDTADRVAYDSAQRISRAVRAMSPAWQTLTDLPDMRVLCAGIGRGSNQAYVLEDGQGIILGSLFSAAVPFRAITEFDVHESRRIRNSKGRLLTSSYWGRYVAFLREPESGTKRVIRSPTGELDCLWTVISGVRVFFSSTSDRAVLSLTNATVNWDYIATDVANSIFEARETGLTEVKQTIHGECVSLERGRSSTSFYWHPNQLTALDPIEDVAVAAQTLRSTAKECIHAWASQYRSILHMLSGGLDSSIVLGCLRDAPSRPRLTCVNYHNIKDPSTDERYYARLSAERAHCAFVEKVMVNDFDISVVRDTPKGPIPSENIHALMLANTTADIARQSEAEATFSGRGGDQLFYQNGARFAYADYVQKNGFTRTAFRMAMDAASVEGGTVWSVLLRESKLAPKELAFQGMQPRYHPLINPLALERARECELFLHPWMDDSDGMSPGKWWHTWVLSSAVNDNLYDPWATADDPENLAVLVSQPLVELSLRMPSYILAADGKDRAIARRAFESDVPAEILTRSAKGLTYDSAKVILVRNADFIRELLLDGALVKEGVLDRQKLEASLSGEELKECGEATAILSYVGSEAWIQSWISHRRQIAA